jgi:hypothetical protein
MFTLVRLCVAAEHSVTCLDREEGVGEVSSAFGLEHGLRGRALFATAEAEEDHCCLVN